MSIVKGAYQSSTIWGLQPSEFWQMTIAEWWWAFDAHKQQQNAEGPDVDWDDLRAKHREKMRAKSGESS